MADLVPKKDDAALSSEEEGEMRDGSEEDVKMEEMEEGKAAKRKHSDDEEEGVKKKKKKKEKKHKKDKKKKKDKEKEKEKGKEKEAKEKDDEKSHGRDEEVKKSHSDDRSRRSPSDTRVSSERRKETRADSKDRVRERTRSPRRDDRKDDRRAESRERARDRTRSPRREERREDRREDSRERVRNRSRSPRRDDRREVKRADSKDRIRNRTRSPRRDDRREDQRDRRRYSRSPARRETSRRDYSRRRTPSRDSRDHRDDRRRRSSNDGRRRDRSDERRKSKNGDEKRERSESPPKIDPEWTMDSDDDEEKKIEEMRKRRQEMAKKTAIENQSLQGTPQAETEDSEVEEELLKEGEALLGRDREMRSESPCTSGTDSPMDFIKELEEKRKMTGLDGTLTEEEPEKKDEKTEDEKNENEKKEEKADNKKAMEFDMFAEHVEIEEITPAVAVLESVDATNLSLKDNWDDAEGYYRVRGGEVLDGRYRVFGVVGNGVFGNVVRCADLERKTTVAIKIARNHDTMRKAGIKEAQMIRKLNEADRGDKMHCLQMHTTFDHHNHLCLVFENQSMNLRELLKKYGVKVGLSLSAVRRYSRQLLLALKLLKKCGIVHADIKPDNILVNETKSAIKLCDFGTSGTISEQQLAPLLVSRFYRAPEIMMGILHDYSIDLWSVAVTLYELYTGKIMFSGDDNNHMLKLFSDVKGPYPNKLVRKGAFKDEHFDSNCNLLYHEKDKVTLRDKITVLTNIRASRNLEEELVGNQRLNAESKGVVKEFANLLDKLLIVDHTKRMTVGEALNHPFIKGP
ncbi:hypothetical protein PMAYCL1PPCAC_25063 [Pristionchus mayeri]|uniref:non-specific serine/threonine protein kinase n=1 Tax=Pristionchus mayeri TaxID=1317129 RepID=A0AAN5I748_9BILA|nr:hypothetical protein PMAYCL1PPCAC_25063 [Pristionchus mayeri]